MKVFLAFTLLILKLSLTGQAYLDMNKKELIDDLNSHAHSRIYKIEKNSEYRNVDNYIYHADDYGLVIGYNVLLDKVVSEHWITYTQKGNNIMKEWAHFSLNKVSYKYKLLDKIEENGIYFEEYSAESSRFTKHLILMTTKSNGFLNLYWQIEYK